MASGEREFEEQLEEAGNRLLQPPSSVDELLPLLDQVENFLSRVEQSPLKSMQTALSPSMKALVADKLLRHPDVDVKVAVASCISEITRITAPDAPYDDDQMKDVFQLIVSSFENLSDKSSRSYNKRTLILETVATVRSCVVMLDLECDGLIVEMFHHFLKSIRDYHPENVFSSMVTIMSLVLEESEDISFELISPILASLKKDNQEVLPIARKLGVRVFENCAIKVKPYLIQAKESLGHSFDDYSKVIASICDGTTDVGHNNDDTVRHNDDDACGEQLVHWMDISSLSNGGGVMKYRSKICYCGSKATIKVTESEKNRGKLYYLCPNGKCGFWEWCKPVNSSVGGEMMMEDTQTTVNRHTLSYKEESPAMNLINQMGAMQTRMQVLEANMGFIKMIMIMNFVMCLISLMVALKM